MTEGALHTGWSIGESIAIELDIVLTAIKGTWDFGGLTEDIREMLDCLPEEWMQQLPEMVGADKNHVASLVYAADLAGVLVGADYSRTTLAIREMTLAEAMKNLLDHDSSLEIDISLSAAEQFVAAAADYYTANYTRLDLGSDDLHGRVYKAVAQIPPILRDGDNHARFWRWIDQLYYACYQPWRSAREEHLATMKEQAKAGLGAVESAEGRPNTGWLPPQNCLLRHPELMDAVRRGQRRVFFLAEPFGLADLWMATDTLLIASFSEAGELYERFSRFADNLAERTKAISDPTRLIILRLVRGFGMINTEIAEFLQVARPTISAHAKILREAGLIHSEQDGRVVRHEVDADALRRLLADLERFFDLPDEE